MKIRAQPQNRTQRQTVGGRIRALRNASGLSQEELGQRLGMPQCAVSRIEIYGPGTIVMLRRLAVALKTTEADLLIPEELTNE